MAKRRRRKKNIERLNCYHLRNEGDIQDTEFEMVSIHEQQIFLP
jgi:hypothetical protein